MNRVNQQGSVAYFVVVATLLVVATGGLLYMVKELGSGNGSDMPPGVAISTEDTKKPQDQKKPTTTPTTTSNPTQTDSSSEEVAPRPSDEDSGSTTPATSSTDQMSGSVTELSQTGPADGLYYPAVLGLLVGTVLLFIRSRSALHAAPFDL